MVDTFPVLPGNSWPVKRAPTMAAIRLEALSQKRTFLPQQSAPRWQWGIPYELLRSLKFGDGTYSELESLAAFWIGHMASGLVFKYRDAEDYAVTDQGFGTGDGETTAFQLVRAYTGSLASFVEPVYAPAAGIVVSVAGVEASGYTVGTTGVITFEVAPDLGAALTWTGEFDWYCRFDRNGLDLQRFMAGMSQTAGPLTFSNELAL